MNHDSQTLALPTSSSAIAQMFLLRREQGVLADLEPIAEQAIESHPGLKRFLAAIALARAESGRIAEARERLNRLISNDLLDEVAETSEQLE